MRPRIKNRRRFFKACLSTASLVAVHPSLLAQSGLQKKSYSKVLLNDESDRPITSEMIATDTCYIFHYPYITTPCFLINLNSPAIPESDVTLANGDSYSWPGGVGPNKTLVAFSAICTHKLSYASRGSSFINFRPEEVTYVGKDNIATKQSQLIYCCSERSVYNPAKGAVVLGGPARQPLTAIVLEHDEVSDHYYAVATLGGELFNEFFKRFAFRLALDWKNENIDMLCEKSTRVYTAENYTENQINC